MLQEPPPAGDVGKFESPFKVGMQLAILNNQWGYIISIIMGIYTYVYIYISANNIFNNWQKLAGSWF